MCTKWIAWCRAEQYGNYMSLSAYVGLGATVDLSEKLPVCSALFLNRFFFFSLGMTKLLWCPVVTRSSHTFYSFLLDFFIRLPDRSIDLLLLIFWCCGVMQFPSHSLGIAELLLPVWHKRWFINLERTKKKKKKSKRCFEIFFPRRTIFVCWRKRWEQAFPADAATPVGPYSVNLKQNFSSLFWTFLKNLWQLHCSLRTLPRRNQLCVCFLFIETFHYSCCFVDKLALVFKQVTDIRVSNMSKSLFR